MCVLTLLPRWLGFALRSVCVVCLCSSFATALSASETSPYLLADFFEEENGLTATPGFPRLEQIVPLDGVFYFAASDGVHGRELWRTDGTIAGTSMVVDLCPGLCSSTPANLLIVGGELFFSAWDGETGIELWKTDGSAAGTVQVADIEPGPGSSSPSSFGSLGNLLLFAASDADGIELWRSDGTPAGTAQVVDLEPGADGARPGIARQAGNVAVFPARVGGVTSLYRTDGTAPGTELLSDVVPFGGDIDYGIYRWGVAGGLVFFRGNDGSGTQLWRTDGTASGTFALTDEPFSFASRFAAVGNKIVFGADGVNGDEPWVSDGTVAGTFELADIYPGGQGCGPWNTASLPNGVVFTCSAPGLGRELWFTDGTSAGTRLVKDIVPGASGGFFTGRWLNVLRFTSVGDRVVFFVDEGASLGVRLWASDGTEAGTQLLSAQPGGGTYLLSEAANGRAVVWAFPGELGVPSLRVTDGTAPGTDDLGPFHSQGSSFPQHFVDFGPGRTVFRSWVPDSTSGAVFKHWLLQDSDLVPLTSAAPLLDNGGFGFYPEPFQLGGRWYYEVGFGAHPGLYSTLSDLTDVQLEGVASPRSIPLTSGLVRWLGSPHSLEWLDLASRQSTAIPGPSTSGWIRDPTQDWVLGKDSVFVPSASGFWEVVEGGAAADHAPLVAQADSLAVASSGSIFFSAESTGSGREVWSYDPLRGATEIPVAAGADSGVFRVRNPVRWPATDGFWDDDDTYGLNVLAASIRNR